MGTPIYVNKYFKHYFLFIVSQIKYKKTVTTFAEDIILFIFAD